MDFLSQRFRCLRLQGVRVFDRFANLREKARLPLALGEPELFLKPRLHLGEQPLRRRAEAVRERQARGRLGRLRAAPLADRAARNTPVCAAIAR
jgi:hypothetical protein